MQFIISLAFWIAVATASLFMVTPLSKPVWLLVTPFQGIHFPWRFSTVLTLATATLVAYGLACLRNTWRPGIAASVTVMALLAVATLGFTAYMALTVTTSERVEQELVVARGITEKTYWPRWTFSRRPELRRRLLRDHEGLPYGFELPYLEKFGERAPRALTTGTAKVEVRVWRPRDIVVRVDAPAGASVVIGQFFYPGWTARIVGAPCCLPLGPSDPDGLISIEVPPGEHVVGLRLRPGPEERLGMAISAAAALVTLALALWLRFGGRGSAARQAGAA